MPCRPLTSLDGKTVGFACSRGRRSKPCAYCSRPSSRLCDFPVMKDHGIKGTCDCPLCDRCTTGFAREGDLCRAHAPLWDQKLGRPTVGPGTTEGPK